MSSAGSQFSSKGGSSHGSSHAGTQNGGSAAVSSRTTFFAALQQFERPVERKFSLLRLAVDLLQIWGLFANPNLPWADLLRTQLGAVLYATHVPLFDANWLGADLSTIAVVWFWVALTMVAVPAASALLALNTVLPLTVITVMANAAHAIASFLTIPMVGAFLSMMVCDVDGAAMFWYPAQTCGGAFHIIHFAFGVVGCLLVAAVALVNTSLLFDDNQVTHRLTSRSRSTTTDWLLFVKLGSVVAFHVFLAKQQLLAFTIVLGCLSASSCFAVAFTQPYYTKSVNRYLSGTYMSATLVAVVALLLVTLPAADFQTFATILFFIAAILGFVVGAPLPSVRHSQELNRELEAAQQGRMVAHEVCTYPNNLPEYDLVFTAHKALETELFTAHNKHAESDDSEDEEREPSAINILLPFITEIHVSSDVELASRVLLEHHIKLQQRPTDNMNAYVSRIFTKGFARFRNNASLSMDFCNFLFGFAFKPRIALKEAEQVMNMESSLAAKYRSFKLQLRVKTMLNLSDNANAKVLNSALQIHKELLVHLRLFWSTVMAENGDAVQLANIVNTITTRRAVASAEFARALRHANAMTLSKYARFLDQIMHDTAGAKQITMYLADREQQKNAKKDTGGSAMNMSSIGMGILDGAANVADSGEGSNTTITRLNTALHGMFLLLVCLLGLFFVLEVTRSSVTNTEIDRLRAAGEERMLASYGGFLAAEVQALAVAPANTAAEATRLTGLRAELLSVSQRFSAAHNALTRGALGTSYSPFVSYMQSQRVEIYEVDAAFGYTRTVTDLWNLGGRISTAFATVSAAADGNSTLALTTAEFIRLNAADNFAVALNASLAIHLDEQNANSLLLLWVLIALIAVAYIVVFVIYGTLIVNFATIGAAKLSILSLFSLIPIAHLQDLHRESQDRVAQFNNEEQDIVYNTGNAVEDLNLGGNGEGNGNEERSRGENSRHGSTNSNTSHAAAKKKSKQEAELSENNMLIVWDRMLEGQKAKGNGDQEGDAAESRQAEDLAAIEGMNIDLGRSERDAAKPARGGERGFLASVQLRNVLLLGSAAAFLALLVAAFALVFSLTTSAAGFSAMLELKQWRGETEARVYGSMADMSDAAQAFALSGSEAYLYRYAALHADAKPDAWHRQLVARETDAAQLVDLVARRQVADDVLRRQAAAMFLAARGFNSSARAQRHLVQAPAYNFTTIRALQKDVFSEFGPVDPPILANAIETDAAVSAAEQVTIARGLIFDDTYEAHFALLERRRRQPHDALDGQIAAAYEQLSGFLPTTLVLYGACVLLMGLCVGLMMSVVREGEWDGATRNVSLAAAVTVALLIVANVTILSVAIERTAALKDAYAASCDVIAQENISQSAPRALTRYARSFTTFGNKVFFHRYRDEAAREQYAASHAALLESEYVSELGGEASLSVITRMGELRTEAEALFHLKDVASLLTVWGYNYTANSTEFAKLDGLLYSRARARGGVLDRIVYASAAAPFTNNTNDYASYSSGQQREAGIAALINARHQQQAAKFANLFAVLWDEARATMRGRAASATSAMNEMLTVLLSVSGAALCLVLVGALYVAFYVINATVVKADSGSANEEELFTTLTMQCRVTLTTIFVTFVAVFVYDAVTLVETNRVMDNLNLASMREWQVAQSGMLAQAALDAPSFPLQARQRLVTIADSLLANRMALYAGAAGDAAYNSVGSQNAFLFGASGDFGFSLQSDCDVTAELSSAAAKPAAVDVTHLGWIKLLHAIVATPSHHDVSDLTNQVRTALPATVKALYNSTAMYHTYASETVAAQGVVHYVITAVAVAWIVVMMLLIYRPMILRLTNENDGTRLLLRMIPQNIREDVPAIAEYLEHGTVTQKEKMQRISEAVVEMSTVAYVVIDWTGIVSRFSSAAEKEFGYEASEVVGQNIKMLTPPEIAKNHDQYLLNYRATGVKHVIDTTRRVRALAKDGTTFPVEVSVCEYRRSARDSTFLGFIRNVTATIEFERGISLNQAISDMNLTPVFIMDKLGVIYRTNKAASEVFGFPEAEFERQNIKMIMPPSVQEHHDRYLSTYQRTKIKTVVDGKMRLTGVRKNGESFPVMSNVREMTDGENNTIFFIGYITETTSELLRRQNHLANESIIDHSPLPVIMINMQGQILRFNHAATTTFEWSTDEVLGQNVKRLMKDSIAANHDGYLKRYAKTGVKTVVDAVTNTHAKRKSGQVFTMSLRVKQLRMADTNNFVAFGEDLTSIERRFDQQRKVDTTINACPLPIVIITRDGSILTFSLAACKMFGYRAEEVTNQNIRMLTPPEIERNHDGYLKRYHDTGVKRVVDTLRRVEGKHKNGSRLPVEINVKELHIPDIREESGTRQLFVGFVRSTLEDEKMQSANHLNTVISNLCTTPLLTIDLVGQILTVNRACCDVFRCTEEDVLGKNIKLLQPEHIARKHDAYLSNYLRTRVKTAIDTIVVSRAKRWNGEEFSVELGVKEITKVGLDSMYIATVRDVTDELVLNDAKTGIESVIATCPMPIITITAAGAIRRFSKAAERVFKWDAADILGKNVKVLMPQEMAKQHDKILKTYMMTGVKGVIDSVRKVEAQRKDGHMFSVELLIKEIRDDEFKGDKLSPPNTLFLAYVRDLSMHYVAAQTNAMKDVVLDECTTPIVQADVLGDIVFTNRACARQFGYDSAADIIGKNVKMLMPASVAVGHDAILARYKKTRVKKVIDSSRLLSAVRKDGSEYPMELTLREIDTGDGVMNYVGFVNDVSLVHVDQNSRLISNTIMDLSHIPLIVMSDVGIVKIFNRASQKLWGYTSEEVLEKNIKMLQPKEIADNHDGYLAAYKATGIKNVVDNLKTIPAKRKDGEIVYVQSNVRELQSNGETLFIGYLRDLTQDRRFETLRHFAEVITSLSIVPLISIDQQGLILKMSRAAQEEWAFSEEELLGENIRCLMPPSISSVHDMFLKRYLRTGKKTVIDTITRTEAQRRDGSTFPVELMIREITKEGTDRIYVGFANNISERLAQVDKREFNNNVTNMLSIPYICITELGIIEQANPAAAKNFGYDDVAELIGGNIKMLTPDSIAVQHDGFLKRYLVDGIKRVVDTTRHVPGKRKNGETFDVEILVKENINRELGKRNYLGFLRDRTQEIVREKATKLGVMITDMSLTPIIIMDSIGTIMSYSSAAVQTFQFTKEEVVGNNIKMLMNKSLADQHDGFLKRYFTTGVKRVVDQTRRVPGQRKDKSQVSLKLEVKEIKDAQGNSIFASYVFDVQQAEKDEEERRLLDLMCSVADVCFILMDPIGTVKSFNEHAEALFGYAADEVVGQNIKMLMPEDIAVKHDGYLYTYSRTQIKHVIDTTRRGVGRHKSGRNFTLDLNVTEIRDEQGVNFLGFLRDVSETVVMEERFKVSSAILSLATTVLIIASDDGRIVQVSERVFEIFGLQPKDVVGQNLKSLMPESVAVHHDGYLRNYKETRVKTVIGATTLAYGVHADGHHIPVLLQVKELTSSSGQAYYAAIVEYDATREAEAAKLTAAAK
jgi:PAS domain S-box-containing protein